MESKLTSSLSLPMAEQSTKSPYTEAYTNLNALAKLKVSAKENQDEALPEVAKQFESLLIGMLIKTMRQSTMDEDSMFKSSAGDSYQSMHDKQLSLELAKGDGIGLADSIIRQLKKDKSKTVSPINIEHTLDKSKDTLTLSKSFKMPKSQKEQERLDKAVDKMSSILNAIDEQKISLKKSNDETTLSSIAQNVGEVVNRKKTELTKEYDIDFSSPEKFVQSLWPMAEKSAKKIGVDPQVLLAQAALETGWGQSIVSNKDKSSLNLFNIKADSRWNGDKMQIEALEYEKGHAVKRTSHFRAYESAQKSFDDYVDFIKSNPRYQSALSVSSDAERYLHGIHQAGYATDPNYADKIIQVMKNDSIQKQVQQKST